MFGCERWAAASASRRSRSSRTSEFLPVRTALNATFRPSSRSRASQTTPKPPRPISRSSSKRPITTPGLSSSSQDPPVATAGLRASSASSSENACGRRPGGAGAALSSSRSAIAAPDCPEAIHHGDRRAPSHAPFGLVRAAGMLRISGRAVAVHRALDLQERDPTRRRGRGRKECVGSGIIRPRSASNRSAYTSGTKTLMPLPLRGARCAPRLPVSERRDQAIERLRTNDELASSQESGWTPWGSSAVRRCHGPAPPLRATSHPGGFACPALPSRAIDLR